MHVIAFRKFQVACRQQRSCESIHTEATLHSKWEKNLSIQKHTDYFIEIIRITLLIHNMAEYAQVFTEK